VQLTANSSLQSWLNWLLSIHPQEIDLGLDRVRQVAKNMGLLNPKPLVIMVAGTNGKGSSIAMLSSIYQAAGYKVACYTSPHLLKFNERFQINNKQVTDLEITTAFAEIEHFRKKTADIKLTYFEFATLAALKIFAQKKIDLIILEVGLGGRLDAVNIIDADATLITSIGVDHVDWLGSDIENIGKEKAAIMREAKLSVCSDPSAPNSINNYALQNNVDFIAAAKDFSFNIKQNSWDFISLNNSLLSIKNLVLPNIQGDFQIQNAAGVVTLVLLLQSKNIFKAAVKIEDFNKGFQKVNHLGRLQSFTIGQQSWLVDVAHNVQSMRVLAEYLQQINFKGIAIFSALNDKDYVNMLLTIKPFITNWYIADLQVTRSIPIAILQKTLIKIGVEEGLINIFENIDKATTCALNETNSLNVLVCGSFFSVAQCYTALQKLGIRING
jgi:dihydrofolate synthase/folylpolyglutamate synthase